MDPYPRTLSTVGVIARRYDVPIHRVEYLIRARGIEPTGWAGNARVFAEQDVARLAADLAAHGTPSGATRQEAAHA